MSVKVLLIALAIQLVLGAAFVLLAVDGFSPLAGLLGGSTAHHFTPAPHTGTGPGPR